MAAPYIVFICQLRCSCIFFNKGIYDRDEVSIRLKGNKCNVGFQVMKETASAL